jgi:hypothetical protein
MAKYESEQMLSCVVKLSVKQALALRDLGVDLEFRCPNTECNQTVQAISKGKYKEGTKYKAHFEHLKRNPNCRYGVGIKVVAAAAN